MQISMSEHLSQHRMSTACFMHECNEDCAQTRNRLSPLNADCSVCSYIYTCYNPGY